MIERKYKCLVVSRERLKEYHDDVGKTISDKFAKKKFDGITILTKFMKKQICSELGIDERFIGIWTSGVDDEMFLRYVNVNVKNFFKQF
jgi:hypothetical protein